MPCLVYWRAIEYDQEEYRDVKDSISPNEPMRGPVGKAFRPRRGEQGHILKQNGHLD